MALTIAGALGIGSRLKASGPDVDLPEAKADLPAPAAGEATRTAIFAGGCFWCTEGVFESLTGVTDVVSGYAGGPKSTANYEAVCSHLTPHAEAIKITYDPSKITYAKLMQVFFTLHDPTTKDRQGPDSGHQYRSAIFYENDDQKRVAEAYIKQLGEAKSFGDPVVTTVEPLVGNGGEGFFSAEDYHQDFVRLNPNQGYVCSVFPGKKEKLEKHFKTLLKAPATQPASQDKR